MDLRVMGTLLRQGRRVDACSGGVAFVAVAWLVAMTFATADVTVVACLVASLGFAAWRAWLGVRIAFDAGLFLAAADAGTPGQAAEALDRSLIALRLVAPERAGRDWPARWQGARALMRTHFIAATCQCAVFAVALAVAVSKGT